MDITVSIPAFVVLVLALPVLLLGEKVVRASPPLARLNIPTPVVGGSCVALFVLSLHLSGVLPVRLEAQTAAPWWTFWATTHAEWQAGAAKPVVLPLLAVFYTTLGLGASWDLVKRGGPLLAAFVLSTFAASVLQNAAGVGVARALGEHGALGIAAGSAALMGGFSTAVGFAPQLEALGLRGAAAVGTAVATFGLVVSNLVSAPAATLLIRRKGLAAERRSETPEAAAPDGAGRERVGIFGEVWSLGWGSWRFWRSLLLLLACAKAGAYVSYAIALTGVAFPIQVGAMIVGLAVRHVNDRFGASWVDDDQVERIGSVALSLFVAVAVMTLDLTVLGAVALPLFLVLAVQVVVTCAYALWANFRLLGRDYEAAVTSGGLLGFALGATPNAIAAMKSLTAAFGPAPRAFLIVPVTGAFLSDVANVLVITVSINLMR